MKPIFLTALLVLVFILKNHFGQGVIIESAVIAEATEIIGVVKIGISLVDYIYRGKNLIIKIPSATRG